MQAAQQTIVCPKLTDAQIQSGIENLRWQEKQAELNNAFNRQQQAQQINVQQSQIRIEHQHYMVDHLATPMLSLSALAIIAFTVIYLVRRAIEAGIQNNANDNSAEIEKNRANNAAEIQKNKDDNQAEVMRAQDIIDKHESNES
jgi:hypothetical protein